MHDKQHQNIHHLIINYKCYGCIFINITFVEKTTNCIWDRQKNQDVQLFCISVGPTCAYFI